MGQKVGDELTPGEAIAEIETDKASMDFEFQEEGYLAKILDAGAKDVPVGQPIVAYVEDAGEVAAFEISLLLMPEKHQTSTCC